MENTQTQEKKLYSSAFILYLNYFIHGIGCSILGQQVIKESLAMQWNSSVESVKKKAAELDHGRIKTLP